MFQKIGAGVFEKMMLLCRTDTYTIFLYMDVYSSFAFDIYTFDFDQ